MKQKVSLQSAKLQVGVRGGWDGLWGARICVNSWGGPALETPGAKTPLSCPWFGATFNPSPPTRPRSVTAACTTRPFVTGTTSASRGETRGSGKQRKLSSYQEAGCALTAEF